MSAGGNNSSSNEYTYRGLSVSLVRGLLERPWLPLAMWKALFKRSLAIGVRAAPTAFLMALCVGFVISLVLQKQLAQLGMDDRVPRLVWAVLTHQLAPMITAVVFIGRSVSGSAAELANMKVAEEIKALETMGVDISRYLLLPILGAFVVMLPIMEIYTLIVGLLGAYGVSTLTLGMSTEQYVIRALEGGNVEDVMIGFGKAAVFAVISAMIAFRKGLNASGGSDEVGRVATSAVVSALVAITLVNAVMTAVHFANK